MIGLIALWATVWLIAGIVAGFSNRPTDALIALGVATILAAIGGRSA